MKILIVDDEDILRSITQDIILMNQWVAPENIILAVDGYDGWQKFQQHQPDLVISDMMMPNMNGAELVTNIRNVNQVCEIVIMTAYAEVDMALQLIRKGVYELLRKPFKPQEMALIIGKIVEKLKFQNENEEYRKQIAMSEKLASVGLFTVKVAHEINNPNNFVKGNLELLKKFLPYILPLLQAKANESSENSDHYTMISEKLTPTIETALSSSTHIHKIVSQLLHFSRGSNSYRAHFNTLTLVEAVLALLENKIKNIKIQMELTEQKIFVNEQEMVQVLINLVKNAVDAVETGANKDKSPSMITIKAWNDLPKQKHYLAVQDNGIGIESENIHKIYDPFFTTKEKGKGTGLGLSISKGIIESHQGTLEVTSEANKGTTFTITLPMIAE